MLITMEFDSRNMSFRPVIQSVDGSSNTFVDGIGWVLPPLALSKVFQLNMNYGIASVLSTTELVSCYCTYLTMWYRTHCRVKKEQNVFLRKYEWEAALELAKGYRLNCHQLFDARRQVMNYDSLQYTPNLDSNVWKRLSVSDLEMAKQAIVTLQSYYVAIATSLFCGLTTRDVPEAALLVEVSSKTAHSIHSIHVYMMYFDLFLLFFVVSHIVLKLVGLMVCRK